MQRKAWGSSQALLPHAASEVQLWCLMLEAAKQNAMESNTWHSGHIMVGKASARMLRLQCDLCGTSHPVYTSSLVQGNLLLVPEVTQMRAVRSELLSSRSLLYQGKPAVMHQSTALKQWLRLKLMKKRAVKSVSNSASPWILWKHLGVFWCESFISLTDLMAWCKYGSEVVMVTDMPWQ